METFVVVYLTIGIACGAAGFAKMNPSTQPGHLLAAIIASVVIMVVWPLWIVKALYPR